ncbi:MAG: glycoside hydrolase family 16 protein [Nocardioidaceae bacterium]|nr:glycoside hydrolase family 16 protein [Nocardioidaceae bacterium]
MRMRISTWAKPVLGAVVLMMTAAVLSVAPASAAASCGATVYKSDGTPWTCTFADDFTGTSLDRTKWYVQKTATDGYTNGGECYVDSSNNIGVSGGLLTLTMRKGSIAKTCTKPNGSSFKTKYTSGSVTTLDNFTQAYGRWEIRAQFQNTKVPGIQSSIWMWPQTQKYGPWPLSGEIDIAEWYSKYYDRVIPYLHYGWDFIDPNATSNTCLLAVGAWHTYVLEWTPSSITISYDGKTCIRNTKWMGDSGTSAPFDQPFMVALTQILGSGNNAPVWNTPKTSAMKVDYVKVWS